MSKNAVLDHVDIIKKAPSITKPVRISKITPLPPPPAGFNPLKADQLTLWRHGLPRRPKDPVLLKHWLELVGKARQYVVPTIKVNEHRRHEPRRYGAGTETSFNWSGAVAFAPATSAFDSVGGQWTVPDPRSPSADGTEYYSCVWVGIDGDGSGDVFQAGVECDVVTKAGEAASRTVYAWFEWFPDYENAIPDFPVSVGDVIQCRLTLDQDCLPSYPVAQGQWQSVRAGQTLVPMQDGRVLDWFPYDGSWRLWNYDPTSTNDCLPGNPVAQGQWGSIRSGHTLIPMHDGRVLDWVPYDGSWRLWNYDPTSTNDCLPGNPVAQGQWESIRIEHTLIPMQDGRVLDWVPFDGSWRLWNYDPTNTKDCLPGDPAAIGQWQSVRIEHTLVPMHDGRVLDWVSPDGTWRLWNYDPNSFSRTTGSVVLVNETQNKYSAIRMTAPEGTALKGNCAEWIVERPSVDNVRSQLADYSSVTISRADGVTAGGNIVAASAGDTITMTDDQGNNISAVTVNGDSVTCTYI